MQNDLTCEPSYDLTDIARFVFETFAQDVRSDSSAPRQMAGGRIRGMTA
jgi:hypothetical protein